MGDPFEWSSGLGVSVAMFILIGALWIFVGALTVPLHHRDVGATAVFITERVDTAFFGRTPSELLSGVVRAEGA